jgi:hypothetical protein
MRSGSTFPITFAAKLLSEFGRVEETIWEAFVDTVLFAGGVLLKIEALITPCNVQTKRCVKW